MGLLPSNYDYLYDDNGDNGDNDDGQSQVENIWDRWKIRMTISLSLILQLILILLGNRRKLSSSNIVRVVLWLAYIAADSVATLSLTIIASKPKECIPLWAPLILMHFGGRDTITAYSLEDNNLWHRHLLQIAVAVYVLFNTWENGANDYVAILLLFAGAVKMGERIWSMWYVSRDHLRESLLPPADPGPINAGSSNEARTEEGHGPVESSEGRANEAANEEISNIGNLTELDIFLRAQNFFGNFKPLFADLLLNFNKVQGSQSFFRERSYTDAFRVIEVELGFTYDFFYTKAVLVHSLWGLVLRCVTVSCTLFVCCAFLFRLKYWWNRVDAYVTSLLLVGALVLEILAVVILLFSDWAVPWLGECNRHIAGFLAKGKKWSNSMARYNLIRFCLKDRPTKCNLLQNWRTYESVKMHLFYKVTVDVPKQLKDLIFQEILKKLPQHIDLKDCKDFCSYKGNHVLQEKGCQDILGWSVEKELDQSILLWHIATELCYNEDFSESPISTQSTDQNDLPPEAISRLLSEYMVYILAMCPFMLPDDIIGQRSLRDTCAGATQFFKRVGPIFDQKEACNRLYRADTDLDPTRIRNDQSKSVLFDGCRLAKNLQSLVSESLWNRTEKWTLISCVWIEILCYAAVHSVWTGHARQLRRGGELLTHVWLLLAHFGITKRLEVSESHATV